MSSLGEMIKQTTGFFLTTIAELKNIANFKFENHMGILENTRCIGGAKVKFIYIKCLVF